MEYRKLEPGEVLQEGDEVQLKSGAWERTILRNYRVDSPIIKGEEYRRPIPEHASARKLALNAENSIFEALALSGEPISKDTETWLNAAAMLLRRAIESI